MSPHSVAKLVTPRATEILRRERVLGMIEHSLKTATACWLVAPAGYGKTTAAIDYLRHAQSPHVWFRVDEGDQDIAQFFHYLSHTLPAVDAQSGLPVFGTEYAEQPRAFARIFFRAYFARLAPGTILVLDDLHDADASDFHAVLAALFREIPKTLRCLCLSRTLPPDDVAERAAAGSIAVIERSTLEFSEQEARGLVRLRLKHAADRIEVAAAHGWALGLVLMSEHRPTDGGFGGMESGAGRDRLLQVFGRHFAEAFSSVEQDMLLKLNLLPEISAGLADALIGSREASELLGRLYRRQLLITRAEDSGDYFQLHDLFREFLDARLEQRFSAAQRAALRTQAAEMLRSAGRDDEAIAVALRAEAWTLARELILERADVVLAQGRRATVIDWCARFRQSEVDAWLCYWRGVAHVPDDAAAEHWLAQAWNLFERVGDRRGLALTVSRVVLVKTNSWRTYEGLATWTRRAMALMQDGLPALEGAEDMLVQIGMLRALTFAEDYYRAGAAGQELTSRLLDRLARRQAADPVGLRLLASDSLIELAAVTMQAEVFEKAVDSVAEDLADPAAPPWDLGMWLVSFGAKSGRYFHYARRGFPYASAEDALRAAIAIGERASLRNVEFGGLYHLQMQMKFRNDFREFARLVDRLAEIADSRFTTQVAVVADCQAALHARQGDFAEAYRDCDRFMAAIEAANEPMLERWPHYITKYQVLLADHQPGHAVALLGGILSRIDGGARRRTEVCILAGEALEAKWSHDHRYEERLAGFVTAWRDAKWPTVLLNLPELLAELIADALERDIAGAFCRAIVRERRLAPPPNRPRCWPWPLKVHVLGGFRLERHGEQLELGAKPPTRALDILRALSVSPNCACSLETIQDWFWPDLDGDQAKAACEQALHRLRKLLGQTDLVVQREGKLHLATDQVWVDLVSWEGRLKSALREKATGDAAVFQALHRDFAGPLLLNERLAAWLLPVTERVQQEFVDLTVRLGKQCELRGDFDDARSVYLRALDFYPASQRLHKGLIEARLAQDDPAGAISDYDRYARTMRVTDGELSTAIAALVKPLLQARAKQPGRVSDP